MFGPALRVEDGIGGKGRGRPKGSIDKTERKRRTTADLIRTGLLPKSHGIAGFLENLDKYDPTASSTLCMDIWISPPVTNLCTVKSCHQRMKIRIQTNKANMMCPLVSLLLPPKLSPLITHLDPHGLKVLGSNDHV